MSFIWNGVSSDTMKFNVTSRQVYNAPAFDLNAVEVPGRSGDLLNPQNRFKNKQISYTGFLKASDFEGSTWREKLSTGLIQLKGWLCSDAGTYHELTDDYDPGFTRYGYISGETAISDIEDRPFGVTLTVTFNVKPFMYKAGEPMELPETKSASGSIITITDGAENTPLKSAVVNIEPVQDLHGYDYPWPAGGGINKADFVDGYSIDPSGNVVVYTASNRCATVNPIAIESGATYYVKSFDNTVRFIYAVFNGNTLVRRSANVPSGTALDTSGGDKLYVCAYDATVAGAKPMVAVGSIPTAYFSYSNICPISGWSDVNVWVKPTYDTTLTPTATIPLGQTVYGGTLDVVRGKLVIDKHYIEMNGTETWTETSISSESAALGLKRYFTTLNSNYPAAINSLTMSNQLKTYARSSWSVNTTASLRVEVQNRYEVAVYSSDFPNATAWKNHLTSNPLQAIYKLATPIEVDLTPHTIKTLLGTNNIWADAGDMEIEYPIPTENPYPFGSRPLHEITMAGTGTLVVNGKEWTITEYTGTLYCDTEAMEWYDASQLRNNIVSGDGWPVFEVGENSVSYTGDITKVMVTPRWRTL